MPLKKREETGAGMSEPGTLSCPLCGGALSLLVGPSGLSFHCSSSAAQLVNHGELVPDPGLPQHEAIRDALARLLRTWEDRAAFLAKVGASALQGGRDDVGDTFGREAEKVATDALLVRRHLADPGGRPVPSEGAREWSRTASKPRKGGKLEIQTTARGRDSAVLSIRGSVDYSNVSYLRAALETLLIRDLRRIVVDLSRAVYLASCALSALLSAHDKAEAASKRLVFAATPAPIRKVLDLLGLTQVLRLEATVPSALTCP
jgi:anti-anti-sigma factor